MLLEGLGREIWGRGLEGCDWRTSGRSGDLCRGEILIVTSTDLQQNVVRERNCHTRNVKDRFLRKADGGLCCSNGGVL